MEEKERKNVNEEKETNEDRMPEDLEHYYTHSSPFKNSDIDICIYGLSNEETLKKVEYIYNHLVKYAKVPVEIITSPKHIF